MITETNITEILEGMTSSIIHDEIKLLGIDNSLYKQCYLSTDERIHEKIKNLTPRITNLLLSQIKNMSIGFMSHCIQIYHNEFTPSVMIVKQVSETSDIIARDSYEFDIYDYYIHDHMDAPMPMPTPIHTISPELELQQQTRELNNICLGNVFEYIVSKFLIGYF